MASSFRHSKMKSYNSKTAKLTLNYIESRSTSIQICLNIAEAVDTKNGINKPFSLNVVTFLF